jgi:glycosyltransferase involved in cell wall biosynthesis
MTSSFKHKPAILQVLPALNIGGVERGVVDLAVYAKNNGYHIIVASAGGKMQKRLVNEGIEVINFNLKTKNPLKIIFNAFKLARICKTKNVKIIHARSRAPAWSAYIASKLSGVKFVTTFHGFYKNNFPLKKYYNAIMTKGDRVIAVSNFVRKHIFDNYDIAADKVITIHRGVDLHEFNPNKISTEQIEEFRAKNFIGSKEILVLMPGRITRWKGQDIAIMALSKLKDIDITLAIAGSAEENSSYMKELIALTLEFDLEKKVKFLNDVKKMPEAYAASDIILSCSVEPETFGRVSAEAGAMGKFVIASRLGGSEEIIVDGVTGFLIRPKNYIELAKKIRESLKYIADEKTKNMFQYSCRNHINDNFSLKKMCDTTLKLYDELLAK